MLIHNILSMYLIWIIFGFLQFSLCKEICENVNIFCKCDNDCVNYGDCCPGHEDFEKPGLLSEISTCKAFHKSFQYKMWIIDKCRNSSHHDSEYCLKKKQKKQKIWRSIVPVISRNNVVYENRYCARCNNEKNYSFLKVSFACLFRAPPDFKNINTLLLENSKSCYTIPYFDVNQTRNCEDKLIQTCPESFVDDERNLRENCFNATFEIVNSKKRIYKNQFCCQCWNDTCERFIYSPPKPPMFTYMFNFNEWENDDKEPGIVILNSTIRLNRTRFRLIHKFIFFNSFLFIIISVISLTFLIFLYAIKNVFHNFGGYLTICLSICICLMNLIYLLVTNSVIVRSQFCTSLAIIQHFISISTFVWMSLYALDLLQTFGFQPTNIQQKKSFKTFVVYCICGFSVSGVLVGTSTVIEFTVSNNSTVRPKYGGPNCWFTSKYGGIIWYFIPVCLMLMWNFGICILVFYRLMKTAKDCRIIQNKDSTSTLWLCIRLTSVFGIGYVFQILAVLTKNQVLITFGSILNCLQGFLLMICFVCTKRAKSEIKKTIKSFRTNDSQTGVMITSTQKQTDSLTVSRTEKRNSTECPESLD